ncbi:MAG: CBS domain-containing protein [Pirellulales bacterium]|nr:CBS domain-containing protein [Pirellulales bacterium]
MSRTVVSISPEALLQDAMDLILECGVSGLPVVDSQGDLVGIISEADLCLQGVQNSAVTQSVEECMTRVVSTVDENAHVDTIVEMLLGKNIRRVPVVANQKIVGIVSRRDIVRAMSEAGDALPDRV